MSMLLFHSETAEEGKPVVKYMHGFPENLPRDLKWDGRSKNAETWKSSNQCISQTL